MVLDFPKNFIISFSCKNFTYVDAYPFAAFILDRSGPSYCGGALMTYSHVLTAAHCADNPYPQLDLTVCLDYNYLKE